uniref:Glutamate decarboxylase n=1 Tax=Homalodisca liturata TaxID=320908 RepID=A0A1B6J8Y7_9HEMI
MASLYGSQTVISLLHRVLRILEEESAFETDICKPVVQFKHPAELEKEQLFENLGPPATEDSLETVVRDVVRFSVKTQHPLFLNQLYGRVDEYGLAGAWITEALNTNQHTFEVAPVFTLVEMAVIERLLQVVGYGEGDGIFAAGGSMANMYAMVLARFKMCPETKKTGLYTSTPLAAFTSSDSHYSVLKAAHWLGLGMDHIHMVDTDNEGRMLPEALDLRIQEALDAGERPFFVNATAGTTVLGAFDPLHSIADVCHKYSVWLHIDACWGGALFFSQKYKDVLDGAERSDSIAWNPHKMLGAPLQCSVILLKEKELLYKCNSASATYLFQQDKFYDTTYDTGDKSVQCGRKPDAFKLWLMWRARGDEGLGALVDDAMDKSRYFLEKIRNHQDFRLVLPQFQCTNICFWYIPKCLQGQPETTEWWERVGKVAPLIKQRVAMNGRLLIGYQPLAHRRLPNFFRFVLACHPTHSEAHLDTVIAEIAAAGSDLLV